MSSFPGPAMSSLTDKMFNISKKLTAYHICKDLQVDIGQCGIQEYEAPSGKFTVEVRSKR